MIDICKEVARLTGEREKAAIATLVTRNGSAPGALGSKMLVRSDGTSLGSIGGGCVEADVWQAAMTAQKSNQAELLCFRLTAADAAEGGLICGGSVEILVEPILAEHQPVYERLVEAIHDGSTVVLGTALPEGKDSDPDGGDPARTASSSGGTKALWLADGIMVGGERSAEVTTRALQMLEASSSTNSPIHLVRPDESGAGGFLLEVFAPRKTVYLFGGGHLSKEIAPLAKRVGFRVAVIDDRPMFANREVFPDADEVIVSEFDHVLEQIQVDGNSFVVIVTRGHQHDGTVLTQALMADPAPGYIGMIGSRSKVASVKAALRRAGIPKEKFAQVHAPIGVAIHARTPEEIAVSIVAELISARGRPT